MPITPHIVAINLTGNNQPIANTPSNSPAQFIQGISIRKRNKTEQRQNNAKATAAPAPIGNTYQQSNAGGGVSVVLGSNVRANYIPVPAPIQRINTAKPLTAKCSAAINAFAAVAALEQVRTVAAKEAAAAMAASKQGEPARRKGLNFLIARVSTLQYYNRTAFGGITLYHEYRGVCKVRTHPMFATMGPRLSQTPKQSTSSSPVEQSNTTGSDEAVSNTVKDLAALTAQQNHNSTIPYSKFCGTCGKVCLQRNRICVHCRSRLPTKKQFNASVVRAKPSRTRTTTNVPIRRRRRRRVIDVPKTTTNSDGSSAGAAVPSTVNNSSAVVSNGNALITVNVDGTLSPSKVPIVAPLPNGQIVTVSATSAGNNENGQVAQERDGEKAAQNSLAKYMVDDEEDREFGFVENFDETGAADMASNFDLVEEEYHEAGADDIDNDLHMNPDKYNSPEMMTLQGDDAVEENSELLRGGSDAEDFNNADDDQEADRLERAMNAPSGAYAFFDADEGNLLL